MAARSVRLFCALALWLGIAVALTVAAGPLLAQPRPNERDPHIQVDDRRPVDDREFISPPTLSRPIYACGTQVTVKNFRPNAELLIFIDGAPIALPAAPVSGQLPHLGHVIDLGITLTQDKVVTARQRFAGTTSGSSNAVPVTSHTEDYPAGLPRPRLFKHPLRQCGRAVLVEDVVPNATVTVEHEARRPDDSFDPPQVVGGFQASPEWGHNWTGVSPEFGLRARVTASAQLCTDRSPVSNPEITEAPPSPMPHGALEPPTIPGTNPVTVWGAGGVGDPPQHGAVLRVWSNGALVAESPAPGGVQHHLGLNPPGLVNGHAVTQALCQESPRPPEQPVGRCSDLPAVTIRPPLPGDTKVDVLTHVPGSRIVVVVAGEELGDSGGTEIVLKRPLAAGEEVRVYQQLGEECWSILVYVIRVECALGQDPLACSGDWPAFRHNGLRTARQVQTSTLADPYQVKRLREVTSATNPGVQWPFRAPDGGGFNASPVVFGGIVFIGSSNGHLYALDALTGARRWVFPADGQPPLTSRWAHPRAGDPSGGANPSSAGIASSVAVARVGRRMAVILAAPDTGRPDDPGGQFGAGLGSGRIFAIDLFSGAEIWRTRDEVAQLTGLTRGSQNELHEQIGYSSPLVLGRRIYVGIADHGDNPIQQGRIGVVDLASGDVVGSPFNFAATSHSDPPIRGDGTRGGGIWSPIAGGLGGEGIIVTTGNTNIGGPEPRFNHGLSMLRLDPFTGAIQGKVQPVPYDKDGDPDWASGASLMASTCGSLSVSTMKDGWTYGANLGPPLGFRWQFPNTAYPFPPADMNAHGDIRYHRAGAAWNDVFVTMSGGEGIVERDGPGDALSGYRRLHALEVCAGPRGRVRWIADLAPYTTNPPAGGSIHYWGLGPPSVSHGIVYVGTNEGWLVAVADTAVWPGQGARCTRPGVADADCVPNGFQMAQQPTVLRAVRLGSRPAPTPSIPPGSVQRTEPAIAGGKVYVATDAGMLFMLAPP